MFLQALLLSDFQYANIHIVMHYNDCNQFACRTFKEIYIKCLKKYHNLSAFLLTLINLILLAKRSDPDRYYVCVVLCI